ncbi:hypothetical protein DID88_005016 [Monilinia fructigena]|uniref:Uncharacterized protein n=1 Tax=Monilinia fructigena TaxID=38457 RepID=A0A395IQ90_9HELO|nr:hypothetical protein DID88_005016 [Monilinia fructigena]
MELTINMNLSLSHKHSFITPKKLNVIAALLPGPWNPAVAAKQIASIDHYTNGRISVNLFLVGLSKSLQALDNGGLSTLSVIDAAENSLSKADKDAVNAFADATKQAGSSTGNKKGMWAGSKFEDLVQYNDGFKTKLIGTAEQVADRILLLKSLGIDIVLIAFLHYEEDIQNFGEKVLPTDVLMEFDPVQENLKALWRA